MKKYFVYYYTKTSLAIDDRKTQQRFSSFWKFNFGNTAIIMRDWFKQKEEYKLHLGLEFIIEIEADNKVEAKEKSKNFTELILNFISFSMLTSCTSANIINIIEIKEGVSLFPFQYYIYPLEKDLILQSLVKIDKGCFDEIWNRYEKSQHQQRIMRTMTWLRKGLDEEGLDEFISCWMGLEVIKHILRRELKIKNPQDWDGVKSVFEDKINCRDFDKIKDKRNEILHGYEELSNDFVKEVEQYTPTVRRGLIACISKILNLSDEVFNKIVNKNIRRMKLKPRQVIIGNFENLSSNFNELIKNLPKIEIKLKKEEIRIDKEGKLKLCHKFEQKFICAPGVKIKINEREIWGDKHAGIENAQIKIKNCRLINRFINKFKNIIQGLLQKDIEKQGNKFKK